MAKVLSLAAALFIGAYVGPSFGAPASQASLPQAHVVDVSTAAPAIDAEKKAWFDRAMEHILGGPTEEASSPAAH